MLGVKEVAGGDGTQRDPFRVATMQNHLILPSLIFFYITSFPYTVDLSKVTRDLLNPLISILSSYLTNFLGMR